MQIKSFGRNLPLVLSTLVGLGACQHKIDKNRYHGQGPSAPVVDSQYMLSADRQKLEELRQEIPLEKRQENDEEAVILQLFSEVKRSPAEIRAAFDQMLRTKREKLDRDLRQERENFNLNERRQREEFLKRMTQVREKQLKTLPRDRRSNFLKDQDAERKIYFSNEHEKRNDFESQIREKRKNFEDYARAKTNEFNAEMRSYQKRFDEMKKKSSDAEKP